MEINCKAAVGDTVYYISDKGKIMSNRVESIDIKIGVSTYRTSHWVGTAQTPVQVVITYKLENVPAGYILSEDSIHISKEELLKEV